MAQKFWKVKDFTMGSAYRETTKRNKEILIQGISKTKRKCLRNLKSKEKQSLWKGNSKFKRSNQNRSESTISFLPCKPKPELNQQKLRKTPVFLTIRLVKGISASHRVESNLYFFFCFTLVLSQLFPMVGFHHRATAVWQANIPTQTPFLWS